MEIFVRLLLLATALTAVNAYDHSRGSCDRLITIGANESFPIPAFPVETYSHHGRDRIGDGSTSYGPRGIPPRECTWTFQAEGDWSPQFVTTGYRRGGVDCGHQHLLIGDNQTEHRICGFKKPPAIFSSSSGRELFLTHYQRNGDYETVSSVLSGVVACAERSTCSQARLSPVGPATRQCPKSGDCASTVTLKYGNTTLDTTSIFCTAPAGHVLPAWTLPRCDLARNQQNQIPKLNEITQLLNS